MISKIKLEKFTVFKKMEMSFSPGVNVIIGQNGVGKTHLMKVIYAACSVADKRELKTFEQKLNGVFLPNTIGRLVHRGIGRSQGKVTVYRQNKNNKEVSISCTITNLNKATTSNNGWKTDNPFETIFIPVKDMLANAPGFRSLVSQKKVYFEEIYQDIIDKALLPVTRGKLSKESKALIDELDKAISGKVVVKNEMFFLKNESGELEFTLLAEGFRKLGLLYKLIQNESLVKGSVLFWDEPEANLNPKMANTVVRILLALQRMGVQIFISTHNYVLLKEFELETGSEDHVLYHVLYKGDGDKIEHLSTSDIDELTPNSIDDVFSDILDRELDKGIELL